MTVPSGSSNAVSTGTPGWCANGVQVWAPANDANAKSMSVTTILCFIQKSFLKVVRLLALAPDLDPAHKAFRAASNICRISEGKKQSSGILRIQDGQSIPFWNRRTFGEEPNEGPLRCCKVVFAIDL